MEFQKIFEILEDSLRAKDVTAKYYSDKCEELNTELANANAKIKELEKKIAEMEDDF